MSCQIHEKINKFSVTQHFTQHSLQQYAKHVGSVTLRDERKAANVHVTVDFEGADGPINAALQEVA